MCNTQIATQSVCHPYMTSDVGFRLNIRRNPDITHIFSSIVHYEFIPHICWKWFKSILNLVVGLITL